MTDDRKRLLKLIDEAEALALVLKEKADAILENCRKAKATAGGVSTPPNDLQLEMTVQRALAKREAFKKRRYEKNQNESTNTNNKAL